MISTSIIVIQILNLSLAFSHQYFIHPIWKSHLGKNIKVIIIVKHLTYLITSSIITSLQEWISKGDVGPPTNGGTFNNLNIVFKLYTVILYEQFQHKLNYFLFCQKFEKIFTTCAEILIIIIKSNSEMLWLSGLNFKLAIFRTKKCDSLNTLILSHKDNKSMFIILYKYYLLEFLELKNQLLKLRCKI